jgi:hypothetical protein
VEQHLRAQGFGDDYLLAGSDTQKKKLIKKSLPPPLMSAIASSILSHIEGVKEGVEAHDLVRSNKRRPEEALDSLSKRARWN